MNNNFSLSIIIPSRNEMFLYRTIQDILEKIEANTEIIVVLDGAWADPPIEQHERVTIVYIPESIGQRAATNLGTRLSKSDWVMKCDAHCSFGKGFDRILLEDIQPDWTIVPKMYNLHAFDWVCECGYRRYQGPTAPCEKCGKEMKKEILWGAKPNPETTAMRFNSDLKFKYWGGYKKEQQGDLVETMSILGACWMLSREKYWELNICDEEHGGWGQQGTEVACKSWLSGGKLIVDKRTWFSHMFRTQGGDFGFPYHISSKAVDKARKYSKKLWLEGTWDKAIYPLSWLINKFNPPDWEGKLEVPDLIDEIELDVPTVVEYPEEEKVEDIKEPTKGIIFYTDNAITLKIAHPVQRQLKSIGLPITSTSLKPMPNFGTNYVVNMKRGREAYYQQILTALENCPQDIIFFCEHDMLYHPSHFDFTPAKKDIFYFNLNVWKVDWKTGHALKVDVCKQVSGMCCYKELALDYYRNKEIDKHHEPRGSNIEYWSSEEPIIDIRHDNNMTANRWSKDQFRNQKNTEGWTEGTVPTWAEKFWRK
jgi:hypothetical protein